MQLSQAVKERLLALKRINLALQGGGVHGAFTWGVLDRILEDDDIEIAAISGTSAGALNGAALKAGLMADGRANPDRMNNVLLHMIDDAELMNDLGVATKLVPSALVLSRLKTAGRAAAHSFLARHKRDLNRRDTLDLDRLFG